PFPSELDDEVGERIREAGGEYGTTTGRPRRCGWLDLVALKYAIRINGLTGLVLTKLDALTGIDPIGVSIEYSGPEGATFEEFPYHQSMVHKARAEFEMLPGWDEDISGARRRRCLIRLEHQLLTPAREAVRQRERSECRRRPQRDLHAKEPLARPVDVLELEEQRGLVERHAHAGTEEDRELGLEVLVAG